MTVVTLVRFVTWVAKLDVFLFLAELCWTAKTKSHSFNNCCLKWHKKTHVHCTENDTKTKISRRINLKLSVNTDSCSGTPARHSKMRKEITSPSLSVSLRISGGGTWRPFHSGWTLLLLRSIDLACENKRKNHLTTNYFPHWSQNKLVYWQS